MLTWLTKKLLGILFKRYLETASGQKLKRIVGGVGLVWGGSAATGGILSGLRGEWLDMVLSVIIPLYGAITSILKTF
ncbi:MAG: hypothetical protein EXQ98_04025 [Alphaproteobacteria bacterium]|nr:hypothetical protein [Alphaproteobacteria bacterium]